MLQLLPSQKKDKLRLDSWMDYLKRRERLEKKSLKNGISIDEAYIIYDEYIFSPQSVTTRKFITDVSKGKCWYCGYKFTRKKRFNIDHMLPVKRGGTNHIYNLVGACQGCNITKRNRNFKEFINYLAKKKPAMLKRMIKSKFGSLENMMTYAKKNESWLEKMLDRTRRAILETNN